MLHPSRPDSREAIVKDEAAGPAASVLRSWFLRTSSAGLLEDARATNGRS